MFFDRLIVQKGTLLRIIFLVGAYINTNKLGFIFNHVNQFRKRDLHEILIRSDAQIKILFPTWIIPNYNSSDIVRDAIINKFVRYFVKNILHLIIPIL